MKNDNTKHKRAHVESMQFDISMAHTSIKGSVNELIVCTYFLKLGYEVFLNISATGKGDLIVWDKKNPPVIIDVKTVQRNKTKTGRKFHVECSKYPNVKTVGVLDYSIVFECITENGNA